MSNDINIASRATLFDDLNKIFNAFDGKIKNIWGFYTSYSSDNKIYQNFVNGTVLNSLFSALEVLLNDASIRFLISYPSHISSKTTITFDMIVENDSMSTIIKQSAEKIINEFSYKDLKTYLENIYDVFGEKFNLDNKKINFLVEGKASRDIFIHNNSKINSVYIRKAGKYARYSEEGKDIEFSEDYLKNIRDYIKFLADNFKENCLNKYNIDTPENVFKKMWEMSSLNNIVPFEKAWILEDGRLSFNSEFSYGFSSSENALYRFFKYIYHGVDPEKEYSISSNCISYALERWRGTKNERIIFSWLEFPFFF